MARESAYFKEIERLLAIGYEPKHIMKLTGIPKPTVYRIVDKLRKEARYDFNQLMEKDYLWKYQQNLENYSKTIQECNEEIETMRKKYDAIEYKTMEELESLPDSKAMVRATLLSNLISIQSARTSELQKLIQQRDKATDAKAKVFNSGPVVYAIDEWVRSGNAGQGVEPHLQTEEIPELEEKPPRLNNTETVTEDMPVIDDEDKEILERMKDE